MSINLETSPAPATDTRGRHPAGPSSRMLTAAILVPLLCILAGPVSAAVYTVNSTHDPASGDPAACTGGSGNCSLRDALAAADQDPGMDTVVFDVDDTIYLLKQLTVEQPVEIDGGKDTIVRVDQEYQLAILPDRFDEDENGIYEDVPVLQPAYFSENGTPRAMLELHGAGSSLTNLVIDGSITPQAGDEGVARIDWNSDDVTDFRLYGASSEAEGEVWLVAGGILVAFAVYGPVEISDNELRYFSEDALKISRSVYATVTNNALTGGVYDGISSVDGAFLTVADNTVAGFRNGISIQYMSAITVRENDSDENWSSGIWIQGVDNSQGGNLIEGNHVAGNDNSGLVMTAVAYATVEGNTVELNSPFGIDVKSVDLGEGPVPCGNIDLIANDVLENGTDPVEHGGIRIAEGSGFNSVMVNKVYSNSGFGIVIDNGYLNTVHDNSIRDSAFAGIVLLSGSQGNTVSANHSETNGFGIISLSETEIFPSWNTIEENALRNNSVFDAADASPDCQNTWTDNKFRTENRADGCIN